MDPSVVSPPVSTPLPQTKLPLITKGSFEPFQRTIDYNDYLAGAIYSPVREQPWNLQMDSMPYLRYIKRLVPSWPKLNFLCDFMEVSTVPLKWRFLQPGDVAARAQRTCVTVLDVGASESSVRRLDIRSVDELRDFLHGPNQQNDTVDTRVFVLEDLSRCMIEEFGARFDIDPTFFRAQLTDYLWFNTRDPWVELPELATLLSQRNFFTLRYYQTRYFPSELLYERAKYEAWEFNVLRRAIGDHNWKATLDKEGSVFGRVRSKASVWIRQNKSYESGVVAILLIDPSLRSGYPIWNGSAAIKSPPSMHSMRSSFTAEPVPATHADSVIQATLDILRTQPDIHTAPLVVAAGLLQLICSEWFTLITYLDTRLTQIDWEIENPEYRFDANGLDASLRKLHVWRRAIQTQHIMIAETLDRVFHNTALTHPPFSSSSTTSSTAATAFTNPNPYPNPSPPPPPPPSSSSSTTLFTSLHQDLTAIQARLRAIQVRIDNIVNVATASISIEENKRAITQNQNFGRLTYLAVVFVPLSFISSFLSMTSDVASLRQTFWIYFVMALPLTAGALVVVRYYGQLARWFGVDEVVVRR